MGSGKGRFVQRFKWHIITISVILSGAAALTLSTDVFETSETNKIPQTIWLLCALTMLFITLTILSKVVKISDRLRDNEGGLEKAAGLIEKMNAELCQISHNTRLSEQAKSIAYRDADRQSLRESVLEKLHRQDFEATYEIIEEIANSTEYKKLADTLRAEAKKYQESTDTERVNQVIAYITKFLDSFQWTQASTVIERLIKAAPNSEDAKSMRQKLVDKKQERKKTLLALWDEAVKRQETDHSLEILNELDLYLTPNEGLALQEAARDIFRSKLHNLGVTFSLAISEKQWSKALTVGRQITRDFPNSRMAEEIREKFDALKKRATESELFG